jgi:hypothetical protein
MDPWQIIVIFVIDQIRRFPDEKMDIGFGGCPLRGGGARTGIFV